MEKKEYLNEEQYQRTKKKMQRIAKTILTVGLLVGIIFIGIGIFKLQEINSTYSDDSKNIIQAKLQEETKKLEERRDELKAKGVEYDAFTEYTDGEAYELKLITKVLDPSLNKWRLSEYQNNSITATYCSLKAQIENLSDDFNKHFESSSTAPFFMFGAFVIIASPMISLAVYLNSKGREIHAYTVQQSMPINQETMEKMAPTYGKVAKEVASGIKEGMTEDEE